MSDQSKSRGISLIIKIAVGCLLICLVTAIVGIIFLWRRPTRQETQTEGPIPQPVVAITAQTMDQMREVYRIPQAGFAYDTAWSPDGLTLTAAVIGKGNAPSLVQFWDAVTGSKLGSFNQVQVSKLAFSPNGQLLATIGTKSLIVWNVADGRELINIPFGFPPAHAIAFSPDSQLLAFSSKSTVTILEMPGGGVLNSLQHSGDVRGVAFLPNGMSVITASVLASSSSETPGMRYETIFTVWDVDDWQATRTFIQPMGINHMVLSPDGMLLAAGGDSSILKILDMESGEELRSFSGFRFGVPRFAFSPAGDVLAAGEGVGFEAASPSGLRLFDVKTGHEAPMLQGHTNVIVGVAFSPDGRLLATASEDKTVRLWGVP